MVRHALSQPATGEDRAKAIRLLLGTLKAGQGMDAEAMAEGYMFVLDGVEKVALKRAVEALAKGKGPDHLSRTFMPSAPELLGFCEQIKRDYLAMALSTERLLSLPEEKFEEPMSEEHCARMREKIQALGSNLRSV